jgi:hypothetical protein
MAIYIIAKHQINSFYKFTLYLIDIKNNPWKKHLSLADFSFRFNDFNNNFRKITNTENGQITIIGESFERNQIKCWQDFSEKLNIKYEEFMWF